MQSQLTLRVCLSLLASLGLAACSHPENYRWSDSSRPIFLASQPPAGSRFDWNDPSVSVYSFATPTSQAAEASLKDLSDRGQAALIAGMTARGAKTDEIREALSTSLKAKSTPPESATTIESTYKRTLVANVTKGLSAKPGERLVWTWIDIQPVNFVFDGYSVIATDNQVLNIEQVTNATTTGVTGNLGKTGSDTSTTTTSGSPISSVLQSVAGSSAGVTGSLNNVYTTTAQINQQYVKLGADILPEELRIYRESERNLDVAGNTLIALTLKLDPTRWNGQPPERSHRVTRITLLSDDGSFLAPGKEAFESMMNEAPPRCALVAKVQLVYQFRRVEDGRSYVEGEQTARYEQKTTPPKLVEVVPADEVRKPAWRIYNRVQAKEALQLKDAFGYTDVIDFTSYEQAHNFAEWLNRNNGSFAGKAAAKIGAKGSVLVTGKDDALYDGAYFAERYKEPDLAARCARMRGEP